MIQLMENGCGNAVARVDSIRLRRAIEIVLGHWRSGETGRSTRWINWRSTLGPRTCARCAARHGKIYAKGAGPTDGPPLHPNCACWIEALAFVQAGFATDKGEEGADYWLLFHGELPDYYLSKKEAIKLGWDYKTGNLAEVLPGRMIGGDVFHNNKGKLPDAPGRVWYEADVDYSGGYRSGKRIVFSNDGLIFFTDDHYLTFAEIGA